MGQKLLQGKKEFATPFNFGPANDDCITVEQMLNKAKSIWPKLNYEIETPKKDILKEATLLRLDISKARNLLNWQPRWNIDLALDKTISWYKSYYEKQLIQTNENLQAYCDNIKPE